MGKRAIYWRNVVRKTVREEVDVRKSKALMFLVALVWLGSFGGLTVATAEELQAAEFIEETETAEARRTAEPGVIEAGLNIRTDFGIHPFRLDVAFAHEHFRVLLVVDPMFFTDGQTSTDLIGFYRTRGLEPFLGWRGNTIPLVEGSQLQHNLVFGAGLRFPEFFEGRVSGQFGLESAIMLYKHGGGVPAASTSFASGRHYLDYVNFGMFARFHYNIYLGGR